MGRARLIALFFILPVCAGLTAACENPIAAEGPLPFSTAPVISAIHLQDRAPSTTPVHARIEGTFFREGLTVMVTPPRTQPVRLDASQIRDLTRTSFDVELPLAEPGLYYVSVSLPTGASAQPFQLVVE